MKAIVLILAALGMLALPTLGARSKQMHFVVDPIKPNSLISSELVNKIKEKTTQWKAFSPEKNPLYALSDDQLRGLLGVVGDPEAEAAAGGQIESDAEADIDQTSIPTAFDSRTKWTGCVGPIRNQGSCGSCWAVSAANVLSDRFCVASKGAQKPQLSSQYLLSCEKDQMACSGGYMSRVWAYLTNYGTVSDGCSPYVSANKFVPSCPATCTDKSVLKKYKCASGSVVHPTSVAGIQTEIMNNGPVNAAFTVYQDFYNYRSGIYKRVSGMSMGGHAIRMIGWGAENGVKYWIIANSWGSTWGESGFFRIQMGQCGIESQVYSCRPQL